jgi:hypothetical protein
MAVNLPLSLTDPPILSSAIFVKLHRTRKISPLKSLSVERFVNAQSIQLPGLTYAAHVAHLMLAVGLAKGVFAGVVVASGVADSDGLGHGLADADGNGDPEIDADGDFEEVSSGLPETVGVATGLLEAAGLAVASTSTQFPHS